MRGAPLTNLANGLLGVSLPFCGKVEGECGSDVVERRPVVLKKANYFISAKENAGGNTS
jgi:hypothetical protein